MLRTASVPALPVIARAASDLVIFEERISLGARPSDSSPMMQRQGRLMGLRTASVPALRSSHTQLWPGCDQGSHRLCMRPPGMELFMRLCGRPQLVLYMYASVQHAAQTTSTTSTHPHMTRHSSHACTCALHLCMWSCVSGVDFRGPSKLGWQGLAGSAELACRDKLSSPQPLRAQARCIRHRASRAARCRRGPRWTRRSWGARRPQDWGFSGTAARPCMRRPTCSLCSGRASRHGPGMRVV